MAKVLFFLNAENPWFRILRRGVVVAVLSGLAVILQDFSVSSPEWMIPILTAVFASLDKTLREFK